MATYAYTFTSGDTVTPTKLNNARTVSDIVNADISATAAIGLSKLATGALPTAITVATANIVDGNVTTAKIADGNVTAAKLASGAVETAKIADANVTPAKLSQPLTLATAQNTTSGTSIDFTGIPSWAKRITVMLNGVSTNGTSNNLIQIGAGSVASSGYTSIGNDVNSSNGTAGLTSTAGFLIRRNAATDTINGHMTLTLSGSNVWVSSHIAQIGSTNSAFGGGSITLGGNLDRIRLTTVNGTDTFDAGSVNIMYEG